MMPPPEKIQLVLTFDPATGSVEASGPVNNKLLCYGILEMARDAIQRFNAKDEETRQGEVKGPRILLPRGPLPPGDGK
jgi:hypothetical protein